MNGITLAWLATLGVGTYRWEKNNGSAVLPPPSLFVGSALTFSILGVVGQAAPRPAAIFAWGIVVAAVVNQQFGAPANTGETAAQTKAAHKKAASGPAGTRIVVAPKNTAGAGNKAER